MRWKTTVLLLVATIGIGAYVSLYEIKQPTREERERRSKHVLEVDAEAVTQIVVDLPKIRAAFTRTPNGWTLAPHNVRANGTLIDQLLAEASPLAAERILGGSPERPLDPAAFGLDPATGWVTLVAGNAATTLLIGEATPVGENRYVKRADRPDIFVVSSTLLQTINQPLESFRDPLLIGFAGWLAQELTVASPTVSYTLMRRDTDWRLTQPRADRADRARVTTLLNQLGAVEIKRFVDDAPHVEQLATWGFDQPRAEVRLRHGDPGAQTTLFFGNTLPDEATLVYAKRSDEPPLYAVAAADVDRLLQDPNELRAKSCFDFFTGNVTKVEMTREGGGWTIEKAEDQWRDAKTQQPLDSAKIEGFLSSLSDLRIERFVDEVPSGLARYGLEPVKGSVAVWTTAASESLDSPRRGGAHSGRMPSDVEAEPQQLHLGATIEGSKSTYGRIVGRDPVVALPGSLTDLLETTPDQLKPQPATSSSP